MQVAIIIGTKCNTTQMHTYTPDVFSTHMMYVKNNQYQLHYQISLCVLIEAALYDILQSLLCPRVN